jgi:hypothetical protein
MTAPTGFQTVTGKVLSVKHHPEGKFGPYDAMTVGLANGSKVWSAVPKGATVRTGDTITFSATFKHAPGKTDFSFGSKASMLAPPREVVDEDGVIHEVVEGDPLDLLDPSIRPEVPEPPPAPPSNLAQLLAEYDAQESAA